MKVFELAMLLVFAGLGIRSAWHWIRRPFESVKVSDHLLYAMYVTGRVGVWLSIAGAFAIFLSIDTQGQAFIDDAQEFQWYILVPGLLSFLQLVAAVLLRGRGSEELPRGVGE
jgi:hypothetical protein